MAIRTRGKKKPSPKLSAECLGLGLKTVIFFAIEVVQMDVPVKFQFEKLHFVDLQ